jgi:hypothetical protein
MIGSNTTLECLFADFTLILSENNTIATSWRESGGETLLEVSAEGTTGERKEVVEER